jgi:hypothetical protein
MGIEVSDAASRAAAAELLSTFPLSDVSPDVLQLAAQEAIRAALPYITAQDYDRAFQRGVLIGRGEAKLEMVGPDHMSLERLTSGVDIPANQSTERERDTERRHREAIVRSLAVSANAPLEPITVEAGPSDYQVWRDALLIAGNRVLGSVIGGANPEANRAELIAEAEWFHNELNLGPRTARPTYDDSQVCEDCGQEFSSGGQLAGHRDSVH